MKKHHATLKIVLYKSKTLNDGTHPVMLRVTKKRKMKYLTLAGYSCTVKEWDNKSSIFKKNMVNHTKKNRFLSKVLNEANEINDGFVEKGIDFTLEQFIKKFKGEEKSNRTVYEFYQEQIAFQKSIEKIATADWYKQTCKRFFDFYGNLDLTFAELDTELIEQFIVYLKEEGNTTGIDNRLRNLRALYNKADARGYTPNVKSPFRNLKISQYKNSKNPRALTMEELRAIENLNLEKHPALTNARNYFMFSFYTWGMNFGDMARLTWTDSIKDGKIIYFRNKTKSKNNSKPFIIEIDDVLELILTHYQKYKTDTDYIFPILIRENLNPQQINDRIKKVRKRYNKDLKEVASVLKFENPKITSYQARHTMASCLKSRSVSTTEISDIMGHGNVAITESYLDSFGNEELNKIAEKLRSKYD